MTKPVILTGLRANNDLTIGNYFGGMQPIVDMAKKHDVDYQINMFIPDLHSFTTPINHDEMHTQIMHNAKLFVAAGLPLERDTIHLYRQSYVPAHSELAWILSCFTGMGEMQRMTQFKDKSSSINGDHISVGLFGYPILMAADILLYGAKYVPVGDDQTQHLEFARDIAERMNKRFGELFVVPEPVKKQHEFFGNNQGLRIMDLATPNKKMSKSDDSCKGVIFLGDTPAMVTKKIMSATTDDKAHVAYNPAEQPGVSNLLAILALVRGLDVQQVAKEFNGETQYGKFKAVVAQEVSAFVSAFQENLAHVDMRQIEQALERSETAMNSVANETLFRVQQSVGLRAKGK